MKQYSDNENLAMKAIAKLAQVSLKALRNGTYTTDEFERFKQHANNFIATINHKIELNKKRKKETVLNQFENFKIQHHGRG